MGRSDRPPAPRIPTRLRRGYCAGRSSIIDRPQIQAATEIRSRRACGRHHPDADPIRLRSAEWSTRRGLARLGASRRLGHGCRPRSELGQLAAHVLHERPNQCLARGATLIIGGVERCEQHEAAIDDSHGGAIPAMLQAQAKQPGEFDVHRQCLARGPGVVCVLRQVCRASFGARRLRAHRSVFNECG